MALRGKNFLRECFDKAYKNAIIRCQPGMFPCNNDKTADRKHFTFFCLLFSDLALFRIRIFKLCYF